MNNLSVGKKMIVGTYSNEQFTTWKITKRETTVIITRPEANNRKPPQQRKLWETLLMRLCFAPGTTRRKNIRMKFES